MFTLKRLLQRVMRINRRPSISRECMNALVKARSICGPYTPETSIREYARDFLRKYQDGDFRTKFGTPEMSIAEMQIIGKVAGWPS